MRHTQTFKLMVLAAALATGSLAMAQENTPPREQRMDEALQNYRHAQPTQVTPADPRNPQPGPAARAEDSIKRGAHNAGQSIKHGAQKAGNAISNGVEKSGDAVRRTGEKIKNKIDG